MTLKYPKPSVLNILWDDDKPCGIRFTLDPVSSEWWKWLNETFKKARSEKWTKKDIPDLLSQIDSFVSTLEPYLRDEDLGMWPRDLPSPFEGQDRIGTLALIGFLVINITILQELEPSYETHEHRGMVLAYDRGDAIILAWRLFTEDEIKLAN